MSKDPYMLCHCATKLNNNGLLVHVPTYAICNCNIAISLILYMQYYYI